MEETKKNKAGVDEQKHEEEKENSAGEPGGDKLEEMFKAGVHFAYSRARRNPKMSAYIFGVKNNTEIFDLEKILPLFEKAKEFIKEAAKSKKTILFVGTKPGIKNVVEKTAKDISMPYVNERWLGGTLSNFKVIRNRVLYYEKLMKEKESGELEKYTKKERIKINKEFGLLERKFKSFATLVNPPDILLVVDPKEEATAFREAKKLGISVVAILNSDCDPENISYPIPANDSSVKSVEYLLGKLAESYREGIM